MKVSLNWVKEFTNLKLSVDELVEKIGAQLGAVDEVIDLGPKYQGILVAKVISCQPHPNADKLKVCKIDDAKAAEGVTRDSKGLVELVCGAPNVKTGMLAAWIPPGGTVPSTLGKDGEMVLEAREIRGVVSNGMLASAHELDISEDHSGIVELQSGDAKAGAKLVDVLKLDDHIIDIENKMFTHRPDLFGQLGVAREIAGIQGNLFKSPEVYKQPAIIDHKPGLPLEVKVEIPDKVPRFIAEVYEDVQVEPSPLWLQSKLARLGIRPINNIVDITNYIMMETAQPLHAYDYDKVKGGAAKATIVVRHPKKGETIKLLGGQELKTRSDDILIANESVAIGLGGVMGGSDTEVDMNTKNIILECANFDMYTIRRTAMEHGVFTEAVTRFIKGQSPLQNDRVVALTRSKIMTLSGAQPSTYVDVKRNIKTSSDVKVTTEFINARLGSNLSADVMAKLLTNVEFEVTVNDTELIVKAPFWRTDIEIPEDIVEEVGRLYGYDKLPLELPKRNIKPAETDRLIETKTRARNILSTAGANEILTYTFVHDDLLDKVGQNKDNAFKLSNALSPDLQYYRLSLLPSLLEKVHPNIKQGYDEFALFEINPVHTKDFLDKDKLPIEDQRLALVFAASDKTAKSYGGAPYYQAKKYFTDLLMGMGIGTPVFESTDEYKPKLGISQAAFAPFEPKRSALVKTKDGKFIGEIGEFKSSLKRSLKLPKFAAGFEMDVVQLMNLSDQYSIYKPLSRFPKVEQDITLKVTAGMPFVEVSDFILDQLQKSAPKKTRIMVGYLDIFQPDDDKQTKNLSFRVTVHPYERTLTTEAVNKLLDDVAAQAKSKLGAERI